MKIAAHTLISDLTARTEKASETVRAYRGLTEEQLNAKQNPESWSMLECLEHLNLYGDFYLPELEKRILTAKPATSATFKSGVIGNYFAGLMLPKATGMKKMKSPKDKNPANSGLSVATIDRFLKQQEHLLRLLSLASKADLTKTKCAISISRLIKLRLGDTFRFYVYHIERHVAQAERTKTGLGKTA